MYKKFLVIKLRHIGDVLLTTPVFKTLKENLPNSFIAALVNKGTEAVLEKNPYIDQIITYDREIKKLPAFKRYIDEIRFLRNIKKIGFDTTIDLTGGDRAAVISYFSGAKTRIGIKSKGFFGKKHLYTRIFEINGHKHTLLQNLEVLEKIGLKIGKPELFLNVTEDEKTLAKNLIFPRHSEPHLCHSEQMRGIPSSNKKIIHIHPTSRWLFKCWKDEYMAEVIKWLISNGHRVVLTSSADERELKKIESILSYIPSCHYEPFGYSQDGSSIINLAGKLTLRQLIAVAALCDIYFGIDTAPMHIAAALGKPVVALFGPSGAFHWGPWDNEAVENPYSQKNGIQRFGKNIVIQRNWSCIPCGQDGCGGSKISKCLFDIKPDEVIEILKTVLSGNIQ
ncbi:putative lipopolysaccharide heptosyltransferase III [Thermodesulfovibrio sp. 3907-1M]|uniref:Lipopolysaccharide heptosyltransferase 3 n=1 Tax=Thermodesulfovibrio autotrophicus TaxID=3118333 RepID=A0AAU8GVG0_9BACT